MSDFVEARGGLGDLRGAVRLLVGGGADLLGELEDLGDYVGDFAQGEAEIVAQLQALVDDRRALLHVVHGLAGFALNAADQLADFLGGGCGFFGELADLVGDYGKAEAVFTGAGGFDGGVERQQVGLLGDIVDDLDDLADVVDATRRGW